MASNIGPLSTKEFDGGASLVCWFRVIDCSHLHTMYFLWRNTGTVATLFWSGRLLRLHRILSFSHRLMEILEACRDLRASREHENAIDYEFVGLKSVVGILYKLHVIRSEILSIRHNGAYVGTQS